MSRHWRNRVLIMAVVVSALWPLLAACAPADGGLTGMTLDAAGRPTAVVAWCPGRAPDSIYLYTTDELGPELSIALKAPGRFPGRTIEVPITQPPEGWTAEPSFPKLDPHRVYDVYAPRKGNDYTSRGPDFSLGRLRGNGQILQNEYDEKSNADVDVYIGKAELIERARELC
jgi:hypothetical protein